MRKIIHIDMDAFFVAVEMRDNPELQNKAVIVGGEKRGVVTTANYKARRYGIHSAMPTYRAKQLFPKVIVVKPRFEAYLEVSRQIRQIFKEYTDLVEPLSLDEAFLDVTKNKMNNPSATLIAFEIKQKILTKTKLTASAGVSFNKFLAKIASDYRKPNGITLIDSAHAQNFIDNLAIEKFFGIGKATSKKMHNHQIFKGKDIRQKGELWMSENFGKIGKFYYNLAICNDSRKVNPNRIRKSIGIEYTYFENLKTKTEVKQKLIDLTADLKKRLTKRGKTGKTLTLKIRYNNF